MRNAVLAAVMSSLFVCGSVSASAAFVCPVIGRRECRAGSGDRQAIRRDALDDAAKLSAAIAALRAKGVSNAMIVDSLIASYCPAVARNTALSDDAKRAQVRRFAARMVRVVYSLDSADAVILDVPFRPGVVDAINAKAAAERISPEAWVANAVDRDAEIAAIAAGPVRRRRSRRRYREHRCSEPRTAILRRRGSALLRRLMKGIRPLCLARATSLSYATFWRDIW